MRSCPIEGLVRPRLAYAALIALALGGSLAAQQQIVPGSNVNMVSGTKFPDGDPFLQRQNEPTLAVSTRNGLHLLGGSNDYRTVDLPGPFEPLRGEKMNADAWLGLFKSFDGGRTWKSTLLPGYPQDTSPEGMASPIKGRQAATDPVVKSGTNGLFYYAGLAFDRGENAPSTVFVARFIDQNNREDGDPIEYLGTRVVDADTGTRFLDKTAMAVDVPRNGATCTVPVGLPNGGFENKIIPAGNVYVAYAAFTGTDGSQQSQILFSRSTDCGNTWSAPKNLSIGNILNQNAQIAINPTNGHIWVSWRRFQSGTLQSDGIFIVRSTDGGATFSRPVRVAPVAPFDQGTSTTSFRTNAFQTMTIDDAGRIYVAWPERGHAVLRPDRVTGDSRIVVSTSTTGSSWTTPQAIETLGLGHQLMPTLTFHAGKLRLIYYDLREDVSQIFGQYVDEQPILDAPLPKPPRHTMDVYVGQATPGASPAFTSVRLSDYAFGTFNGSTDIIQLQYNPPNLPLFRQGTVPFMGDYIDLAPSPQFIQGSDGVWRFNTQANGSAVSHGVWTDNRDVRPPTDGRWDLYTPVISDSLRSDGTSIFDPNASVPPCSVGSTGMRNQNIYTAKVTEGLFVASPGNAKPLGSFQRAFVITVENARPETRSYRLQIANQPANGQASFLQFTAGTAPLTVLDATVPPFSTVARSVYVTSSETLARVEVTVTEIAAPGAPPLPGGQSGSVVLNGDPTNPSIQNPSIQNPSIQNAEEYNPAITTAFLAPSIQNPSIQNPSIQNPSIQNPSIQNPELSNDAIANPSIIDPSIQNPSIQNPSIQNPSIQNPSIQNQDLVNGAIQDTSWVITNDGNTTASYAIKLLTNDTLPTGFKSQLVLHKTYKTPAAQDCLLADQPHTVLVANIPDPTFLQVTDPSIQNPSIQNPSIQNATISLAPGESANVTLRIVDPNRFDGVEYDAGAAIAPAVVAQSVNTADAQQGITTPPIAIPMTITTAAVTGGSPGAAYSASLATFASAGGTTWTVTQGSLPPGITLDPATGQLSGTPTTPGNYVFTVSAVDGSGNVDVQTLAIKIDPVTPAGFSRVWNGANTDWNNPKNWSPAGVPTANDDVYISAAIPVIPTLTSNVTIRNLVVESGAEVDTNGFTLTVTGNADAGNTIIGTGAVLMSGIGTARGTFPNITISGDVLLAGPLTATASLTMLPGATLNLNGFPLTVGGQLVANAAGGLAPTIIGEAGLAPMSVGGVDVDGLILSRVSLTINGGALTQFDNVRFIDYQPQDEHLTLNHPGTAAEFSMTGLSFFTVPTTGHYIQATDTTADGQSLIINVSASLPGDGSSRSATQGGAEVNWLFNPNDASIAVMQFVEPNSAVVGQPLTYTVLVRNGGPATATNVVLNNPMPTGASFLSATAVQGTCGFSANTVSCNLGNIAPLQTVAVTIVVTPTTAGSLNNAVTVTATESDPGTSDNSQTVSTPVFATTATADLSITKSDSADPVTQGASFSYSLVASNAGPGTATNVLVVDNIPAGVTATSASSTKGICSVSASTVTCQIASLAPGEQATITINATASGFGIVTNTASVFSPVPDPNEANNGASETTVVGSALVSRLYTLHSGGGSGLPSAMSVIDPATEAVTNVLTVGVSAQVVAVSPDGTRLYVSNLGSNSVSVIDPATHALIGTITGTASASGIALNSAGTRAYIAGRSGALFVVDTTTLGIIATVPIGSSAIRAAITPDATRVYIANSGSNNVSVLDTASNTIVATIAVGTWPTNVVVTPDGSRAFVANTTSGTVSVIDTSADAVITTITVGAEPDGMAVTADGSHLYVANGAADTISRIDIATNSVVGSIPLAGRPTEIAILGNHAYVGALFGSAVRVIDLATNTVTSSVPVMPGPHAITAGFVQGASGTADLSASLTDSADPAPYNSIVTFLATVTNNGASPATNVTLTTILPAGYLLVGTDVPSCTSAGNTITCPAGTLAPAGEFQVNIDVRVNALGTATTTARVHAAQSDPQISNNTAIQTTTVNAQPTTFTVTNTDNTGTGSLRDAVALANANAGVTDTIAFNIPGSGARTILVASAITITDPVIIDGASQPGFAGVPLIELRGPTTPGAVGLQVNDTGSVIRSVIVNGFTNGVGIALAGSGGHTVTGSYIGTDAVATTAIGNQFGILITTSNNTIGGMSAAQRNIVSGNISGIRLNGGSGNTIQGNYIGLNAAGNAAIGNAGWGIDAFNGTQANLIGGTVTGAGNVISGSPVNVLLLNAPNNTVQGNIIGLSASGAALSGVTQIGISISGPSGNQIGGTTTAARNIISGNSSIGIQLTGSTSSNVVEGNFIGTDIGGTVARANGAGITFESATPILNRIGGTTAAAANVIAFNTTVGIRAGTGSTNSFLRNSIHSNGGLGIDLAPFGVTSNDAGDADIGVNNLQNFPVLTSATTAGGLTTIQGTLNSTASTTFRLEFFNNAACDASTNGEGQTFVGTINVTTDGSGNASFTTQVPASSILTATATDPNGNTSEFSQCRTAAAGAQTFTVTNTLDSGPGSLRAAIVNANAGSGTLDTIAFNIPGTGVHTISPVSALPTMTNPIVIDGTTQPGYAGTPLIELDGNGISANALVIAGGSSTVRGLAIGRFAGFGIHLATNGGNTIAGNFIGVDATGTVARPTNVGIVVSSANNTIGGTTAADRNVISGNALLGMNISGPSATNNQVVGNFVGTDVSGTLRIANNAGIQISSASNNLIGGTTPAHRNVVDNVAITTSATNNRVEGNYIGTTVSGMAALGGFSNGVTINGSAGNTIGGTAAGAGNLISGNGGNGILLIGSSSANTIAGNSIGIAADEVTPLPNSLAGINVQSATATANVIGGTSAAARNVIAFNTGAGVAMSAGASNQVVRNVITSNGGLGIDLGTAGVTPNDPGDADVGANGLQNFPVITSATSTGTTISIVGTLNSAASTQYRVQFFSDNSCDASGNGEGQTFRGETLVTTDGSGNAALNVQFAGSIVSGSVITATATDPNGNTSEFSQCRAVVANLSVSNTNDSGAGSLRQAILDANATPAIDTITFNVAGSGVRTITLANALPTITNPIVIDGTTQPGYSGTPLIELNGNGVTANGFVVSAGVSTIRGLAIGGFTTSGIQLTTSGGNLIEGNFIGTDGSGTIARANNVGIIVRSANNTIGGTSSAARNVISGNTGAGIQMDVSGATGNVVAGNYIGVRSDGNAALGNGSHGVFLNSGAQNNVIGGTAAGAGNVISGNGPYGVAIFGGSTLNVVQGNLIGTNAAGTAAVPNGLSGVGIVNSNSNGVGGAIAAARNVLSGNSSAGVFMADSNTNLVRGNYIGTDISGTLPLPNNVGVIMDGSNNVVGGTAAAEGNLIAFNTGTGVWITAGGPNSVLGNSVYSNGALGIDLGQTLGLTPNDVGDLDAGANGLQNFPVITSASSVAGSTTIVGTLTSAGTTVYRVQFFSNTSCDASGNGEGQLYLGETSFNTDASGNGTFNVVLPVPVVPGQFITSTVTDAVGNTSEFSLCVAASDGENQPPVANAGPDQTVPVGSVVQLTGAGSSDPENQGLTYTWILNTKPANSTAVLSATNIVNPTFVADKPGTYIAQLVVNDGFINSPSDTVTITTQNQAPIANAGTDQSNIAIGATVNLDGSASNDPDGQSVTYAWSFVSKPSASTATIFNATTATPSFVTDAAGLYRLQLVVNDGQTSSIADTVDIVTVNQAPVANAGTDQNVVVGSTVQLNGGGSTDPDQNPLTYAWTLPTRPAGSTATLTSATGVNPTFVPDLAGTYTARLLVNDGFTDSPPDDVTITVTTNNISMALVGTTLIGIGRQATVEVTLPSPAPAGGVVVTVTSDNTNIVTVGPPNAVTIVQDASTGQLTLNGVNEGTTTLHASAPGYAAGAFTVSATTNVLTAPATLNVPFSQTASFPVNIPQAAPAGGIVVSLVSSNTAVVDVITPTVTIPEGALSANGTVQGVGIGTVSVTASNPSFSTATSQVTSTGGLNIAQTSVTFTSGFPTSITIQLESNGVPVAAPPGGVAVTLTPTNGACVSAQSPVTIPQGLTSITANLTYGGTATRPCSTAVTASSASLTPDTVNATVDPDPGISVNSTGAIIGAGLQNGSWTASLGVSNHGGVTVRIASSNSAVALVSPDANTPGTPFIDVPVANLGTGANYYVQGVEGAADTVTITASAPGFSNGSGALTIVPAAIRIEGVPTSTTTLSADGTFFVRIGTASGGNANLNQILPVRAGGSVTVTITNSNATVARLTTLAGSAQTRTVTIGPNQSNSPTSVAAGGIAFDPLAGGTTSVSATAGQDIIATTAATAQATVTTPGITVNSAGAVIGAGLQNGSWTANLGGSNHGGVTIRIASSNPAVALVSPNATTPGTEFIDVPVPNLTTGANYYLQGVEGATGTVTITASAPGFTDGTATLTIVPAAIRIEGVPASTTSLSADSALFVRIGTASVGNANLNQILPVRAGGSVTVTISNSNATVARLTTLAGSAQTGTITIGPNQSNSPTAVANGGIAFDPLAGGTTTVSATAGPDIIATTAASAQATVTAAGITINSTGAIIGAGLQNGAWTASLGGSNHGGVTMRIASSNPAVALVSPNATTPGTAFIDVPIANLNTSANYYVQGVEGAAGAVTITASAPGFSDGTGTLDIVPAAIRIEGVPASTTSLSADNAFFVRIGTASAGNANLNQILAVRAGGSVTITITNSNATVARLTTLAGSAQTRTVTIGSNQSNSPTAVASGGIAFDPLAGGTTTVSATAGPDIIATTAATAQATVTAPGITVNSNGATIGAGLQNGLWTASLGGSNHGGVTVRIASSNSAVARVSPDANTPGTAFIDLPLANLSTSANYYLQGVEGATGTVTITASAPGFTDGTGTLTIVPAAIRIEGVPASTTTLSADSAFFVRIGTPSAGNANLNQILPVRAGGSVTVTITNSNASVARLTTLAGSAQTRTVTIGPNQSNSPTSMAAGGIAFDPLAGGTTSVSATAGPDIIATTAATAQATVTTPGITVNSAGAVIGAGLQNGFWTANLGGSNHGGVTMRIASSDPAVALVSPDANTPGTAFIDVPVPNLSTGVNYYLQGVEGATGTVTITASAPQFNNGTGSLTIVQPALRIESLPASIDATGANAAFFVRIGLPNFNNTNLQAIQNIRAGSSASVSLSLTHNPVNVVASQLVTQSGGAQTANVTIAANQGNTPSSVAGGGVAFDPLQAGASTVSASIPGFITTDAGTVTVQVTPSLLGASTPAKGKGKKGG